MVRVGLVASVLLGVMMPSGASLADDQPDLWLSSQVKYRMGGDIEVLAPKDEFDCGETIYATVKLPATLLGSTFGTKHALEWTWKNPRDERVEQVARPLFSRATSQTATPQPALKSTQWMRFNRGSSVLGLFDPAHGYEQYIGDWRVEVRLDQSLIAHKSFSVLC